MHPFELYLALNDVAHRRTKVRSPQTNGFVERFHGTIQTEFFQVALRQRFYTSAEDLQPDLDTWLVHHNTERPHRGYRNRGKRPMDTVNDYLTFVRQEGEPYILGYFGRGQPNPSLNLSVCETMEAMILLICLAWR